MNDFASLTGVVDKAANTVTLSWSLAHLPAVNGLTVNSITVQRALNGLNAWSTIATPAVTATTYVDTLGTEGTYSYRVVLNVGHNVTLNSNVVSAGTYTVSTLSATVSGNQVSLSWTTGFGDIESATVQRSVDGGVHWVSIRTINGKQGLDFTELLSTTGSYSYRVLLAIEDPETPDSIGRDTTITSNVVGPFSITGTGQD